MYIFKILVNLYKLYSMFILVLYIGNYSGDLTCMEIGDEGILYAGDAFIFYNNRKYGV